MEFITFFTQLEAIKDPIKLLLIKNKILELESEISILTSQINILKQLNSSFKTEDLHLSANESREDESREDESREDESFLHKEISKIKEGNVQEDERDPHFVTLFLKNQINLFQKWENDENIYPLPALTNKEYNSLFLDFQEEEILYLRTLVHPNKHLLTDDDKAYLNSLIENYDLKLKHIEYIIHPLAFRQFSYDPSRTEYSEELSNYLNTLASIISSAKKGKSSLQIKISEEIIDVSFIVKPASLHLDAPKKKIIEHFELYGFRTKYIELKMSL